MFYIPLTKSFDLDALKMLGRLLHWLWSHWSHIQFSYKVINCEISLNILDTNGNKAIYQKHQRVKFLQNNVIAYQDQAWGDGNIFADYKCSPGIPVDRYQDGNRWRVLISLRESKNRGQDEELHVERTIEDGFVNQSEYFQVKIDHPTQHLSIKVTFPQKRLPRHMILVEQNRNHTHKLGADSFQRLPNQQMMVV